jgi:hypothetical protein
MTEASAVGRGWSWSIGSVITSAASVLVGHFVPFVVVAAIAASPNLLFWLLVRSTLARGLLTPATPVGGLFTVTGIASALANTVILIFLIQTLVYGTVQALRGRKVSIGDCLLQGLKRLPVGIIVGFLAYLGILFGTLLLIVPGLILLTMWAVALPANTVERTGILESLQRSRELTRGRRWRVFATIIIPILLSIATGWLLIGIFGARAITAPTFQFVSWIVHAVEQAFSVCVFATLYFYLRRDKEGVDIEQVAAVFD